MLSNRCMIVTYLQKYHTHAAGFITLRQRRFSTRKTENRGVKKKKQGTEKVHDKGGGGGIKKMGREGGGGWRRGGGRWGEGKVGGGGGEGRR